MNSKAKKQCFIIGSALFIADLLIVIATIVLILFPSHKAISDIERHRQNFIEKSQLISENNLKIENILKADGFLNDYLIEQGCAIRNTCLIMIGVIFINTIMVAFLLKIIAATNSEQRAS